MDPLQSMDHWRSSERGGNSGCGENWTSHEESYSRGSEKHVEKLAKQQRDAVTDYARTKNQRESL